MTQAYFDASRILREYNDKCEQLDVLFDGAFQVTLTQAYMLGTFVQMSLDLCVIYFLFWRHK